MTGTPAGTINYVIDPLGRRVGRTAGGTTRRWFYSGSLRIVGELDPAGTTLTQYVYGTRPNVPEYAIRGAETYRLVTDHLGSLRLVVRVSDQTIVQRMEYDAFGVVGTDYIASGWDPLPFGFAGGLYDRDTKLVRFGARDYEPETGRWTAKDPIGFEGGDTNLSGYAGNDPVNFTDPMGLSVPRGNPWAFDPLGQLGRAYSDASDLRREGHRRFPGEVHSSERHQWASNELTRRHGPWVTRIFGFLNEVQGVFWHDISNLRSRIRGRTPWAFQWADLMDNEEGIKQAEIGYCPAGPEDLPH